MGRINSLAQAYSAFDDLERMEAAYPYVTTDGYNRAKENARLAEKYIANYEKQRIANRNSQYDWMETSGAFDGWSDELKAAFKEQWASHDWSNQTAQANAMWQSATEGIRQNNEQKKADREDILAEIEAYKAGFSDSTIASAVASERQAWDEKINSTMQSAVQQAASQGRVMDTSTYAMLRARLEAQAADAIQQVQLNYEAKRMEYAANAISMKDSVYRNTTNTVMSYQDVAEILKNMAGK